jgi:hypothetical protein
MFRDLWFDEVYPDSFEPCACAFLVVADKPAVADHISSKDRRQPSLDTLFGHQPVSLRIRSMAKSIGFGV